MSTSAPARIDPLLAALGAQEWAILVSLLLAPLILVWAWRSRTLRLRGAGPAAAQRASVWLFAGLLVFVATGMGASLGEQLLPWPRELAKATIKGQALVQLGAYSVGGACAVLMLYLLHRGKPFFAGGDLRTAALALALSLPPIWALAWLSGIFAQALGGQPSGPIAHEGLRAMVDHRGEPWALVLMLGAIIGAPLTEELIYRVGLQNALVRLTGRAWPCVLVSAVLFALSHRLGSQVPWHAVAPIALLGLCCGAAMHVSGRPMVPVLMHALFNALNVALALAL